MRPIERIPIFIKLIDWKDLLVNIFRLYKKDQKELDKVLNYINDNIDEITDFWKECQDLRISQVLVSMNIIPNSSGMWYYMEEDDILLQQGNNLADILLWGTFGKSGKDPFKRIPISSMTTDHIQACLDNVPNIHPKYIQTMKKELKDRETKK